MFVIEMRSRVTIIFSLFLVLCGGIVSTASAEVIVLKNGQVLEGRILETNDYFIRFKYNDSSRPVESLLHENIANIYPDDQVPPDVLLPSQMIEQEQDVEVEKVVLSNETIGRMDELREQSSGSFTVDPGQDTGVYVQQGSPDQQAMIDQMNAELKSAMPSLVMMMARMVLGFLVVVVILAFIINKLIDDGPIDNAAGFWRRFWAFMIDTNIGSPVIGLLAVLPGVFVPLDSPAMIPYFIFIFILIALYCVYFGFGYVIFNNTYGRYVANIRIVDYSTGAKPGVLQAIVRGLTMIIWPIEAMVIIISKSKRRLGDAWSKTWVKKAEYEKSWYKRFTPGAAVILAAYILIYALTPIANGNTHLAAKGRDYLDLNDIAYESKPYALSIESDQTGTWGSVSFRLKESDQSIVLKMLYKNDEWVLQDVSYIKYHFWASLVDFESR